MLEKVNLADELDLIDTYWEPKTVGALNGQCVRLAKVKGEFVRHKHGNEDELHLVLSGVLEMGLDEGVVRLEAGEFLMIPRGVSHAPRASEEVHLLLFEPLGTVRTGDSADDITAPAPNRL